MYLLDSWGMSQLPATPRSRRKSRPAADRPVAAAIALAGPVAAVRRFNRLYTRQIGILDERMLQSDFSLAEVRVLYELAHRDHPTATEIGQALGIDGGYLSRMLRRFIALGLVEKGRSDSDGRQSLLALTRKGRTTFAALEGRQEKEVAAMLSPLSGDAQARLVEALRTVGALLGDVSDDDNRSFVIRSHRPGDMGWIVQRHGQRYAEEYGWNDRIEALTAEITARFLRHYDPKREHCWIAERDSENVGSVMLVRKSETVAQLRLLLVEPRARGLGIGARLVEECIAFARHAHYRKMMLWTNDVLVSARKIYESVGFRLVNEEKLKEFGVPTIGQTWEMRL